ncbi:MAG: lytic murein transglycosylase, partial [Pseudomonadota bacterium]
MVLVPVSRAAILALVLILPACAETAPLPTPRPAAPEPVVTEAPAAPAADFASWRAAFRTRALAEGISPALFERAFAGVSPNATVIERDRFQPEFSRAIWSYLDGAVSEARIADGRRNAAAQEALLTRLEAQYGVDRGAIVAIWGLESAYGAIKGDIPVIEALATLAHDGRRQRFGEEQLIAALRILAAGDVEARRMVGSW